MSYDAGVVSMPGQLMFPVTFSSPHRAA